MSIRINRLKIRMPAGTSARPEVFARQIADGLAQLGPSVEPQQTNHLRLRLQASGSNASTQITEAMARALRDRRHS